MQINHNIRAMVTQQSLFLNDNSMTKSLEKLSTGLRINRAQDDAAGLAMSEQMRTQIRGLGKAKRNALDGQAALQIAEGALAEITNMMQRQKELSVQSANDTLTSTERMYLNDEFQALTKEIDRIAKNTDYNGKNVLLFDVDPNKSFGATKLDPYNKDISFLEGANVIYKYFGQDLKGAFANLTVSYGASSASTGATQINVTLASINAVVAGLQGILTDSNIQDTLQTLISISGVKDLKLAGDLLHTNPVSYMDNAPSALQTTEKTASNLKTLQEVNSFLRDVNDALAAYNSASKGEFKIKEGATMAVTYAFANIIRSDLSSVANWSPTSIGSLDRIISQLKATYNKVSSLDGTDAPRDALFATLGAVFSKNASAQMQDDLRAVLGIDTNKMPEGAMRDVVSAWQKNITDLKDAYKTYSEKDIATGSAASEILHIGPNYSTGLGGATSNQIKVNYTAIDVKGLGLQAQVIDTREGAQRAIDKLQETIKITSSNRAAIGTYINRLDYTVNNIASMEFNIQDAESRIRDTDFAKETTDFTRNQIMVQASTSMLAQANSLPQQVLNLIG
jgi:flagellin-like hook-associated protein FlgL